HAAPLAVDKGDNMRRRLSAILATDDSVFDPPRATGYHHPCRQSPPGPIRAKIEGVMNLSRCVRCLSVALLFAGASSSAAAELRMPGQPDYSEGKIVVSYLGDLWLASDDGATPRRLTTHAARDSHPKFSPDGKWIAFSSNRFGNDDVFVMPTAGGTAK